MFKFNADDGVLHVTIHMEENSPLTIAMEPQSAQVPIAEFCYNYYHNYMGLKVVWHERSLYTHRSSWFVCMSMHVAWACFCTVYIPMNGSMK